jgi:hypothetical protein
LGGVADGAYWHSSRLTIPDSSEFSQGPAGLVRQARATLRDLGTVLEQLARGEVLGGAEVVVKLALLRKGQVCVDALMVEPDPPKTFVVLEVFGVRGTGHAYF